MKPSVKGKKIPQICQAGSAGTLINSSATGCESGETVARYGSRARKKHDFIEKT
ncbi:MAG: hypothetical protein NTV46_03160 [Verrucomicrobia bacterium]|nr:hypothetical protein [Verrucomicrobiota bacterium]